MANSASSKGFGTAPVFFTAISTILGAILFLRFGYSVGMLGFIGTMGIIIRTPARISAWQWRE